LSLAAVSFLSVLPITAGGAGGLIAGVAGSADVEILNETTLADIGHSSSVNDQFNPHASLSQDVIVLASDQTTMNTGAGVLAVVVGGVGAGTDMAVINKDTEASIDASAIVDANNNIEVNAYSNEQLISVSGSASGGGLAIAGATNVYVLNLHAIADMGSAARITANGNALITANDDTSLLMVAGDLAVTVPVITKTTLAYAAPNSTVNALGENGTATVDDGRYNVSYGGSATDAPSIKPNQPASSITAFSENRAITPETEAISGVAIVATSTDHVTTVAAAGSAGLGGVSIAGSAFVPNKTTEAYIGTNAQVNQIAGSAAQSVLVAAGSDYYHLGVGGAVTVALGAGADPGVDLSLVTNTTRADIDASAKVAAVKDVQVMASQSGAIVSFAGGLSASGDIGIAGTSSVFSLTDQTLAFINDLAQVNAGGNVLVAAQDNTGSSMIDGAAGIGVGTIGVGGSVGVNLITKYTKAYIAPNATVNALANGTTPMKVFQSGVGANEGFSPTTAEGVSIQAESSEGVFTAAASGAGGFFRGASANVVAGAALDVEANEKVALQVVAGGGTIGAATIGASVALVNVGSLTQAYIANGAIGFSVGALTVHSDYNLGPVGTSPLVSAYGGNLGLLAALGAQVAIVTDTSLQSTHIGETSAFGTAPTSIAGGVQVIHAATLTVDATGSRLLTADASAVPFLWGWPQGPRSPRLTKRGPPELTSATTLRWASTAI
jgi:hypothetical protein